MKELAASPSTYYRKRAGSIYPIVDRLLKQGLIVAASEIGPRQDTRIEVSAAGLRQLRGWINPPLSESEVEHTVDLIRLRLFFLGAVSVEERRRLVESALPMVRDQVIKCEESVVAAERVGDQFGVLGALGSVYESKARVAWLEDVLERLGPDSV